MFRGMTQKLIIGVTAVAVAASQAQAALTVPTLSTSDYEAVAGAVLVGLAVFWGIKKAISLIRA